MNIKTANADLLDVVRIYLGPRSNCIVPTNMLISNMKSIIIDATIVGIYRGVYLECILGWRFGERAPANATSFKNVLAMMPSASLVANISAFNEFVDIDDSYEIDSIVRANKSNHVQNLPDTLPSIKVAAPAMKEGPCRNSTCGKTNDVKAKKCWWCEIENPNG